MKKDFAIMFSMELHELLSNVHKHIEIKEKKKVISREEMALAIGVKPRTYTEYLRGKTNQPLAMKALLNLLVRLDDDEIIKVVRSWDKTKIKGKNNARK